MSLYTRACQVWTLKRHYKIGRRKLGSPAFFGRGHKPQFWHKFVLICGMRANAGTTNINLGYSAIFA
jgi:hypothetical protein